MSGQSILAGAVPGQSSDSAPEGRPEIFETDVTVRAEYQKLGCAFDSARGSIGLDSLRLDWYKEETSSAQAWFMDPARGDDQLTEPQALKAWLRDLQGINGVESFKATVLNRKEGKLEERQHVWVFTGFDRNKEDETRNTRAATLKNSSKDFTSAQLADAQSKVFSFAAWCGGNGSNSGGGKSKKGSQGKLVDVVALRTKFSVKLNTSVKFASTALREAIEKYQKFVEQDEKEFYDRFKSNPESLAF
eukprot:s1023_g28.t1